MNIRRNRRWQIAGVAVLGVTGITAAALFGSRVYAHLTQTHPAAAAAAGKPLPVMTQTVELATIDQLLGAEASAVASELVPIRINANTATVARAPVKVGDVVQKGQLLLQMDDTAERLKLQSARDELTGANADHKLAQHRVAALQELRGRELASDEEVRVAQLQLSEVAGRVRTAQIKLQDADEALRDTRVLAPVSGVLTDGELHTSMVVRGGTDLMTLRAIDPVHVTITLSQDKLKGVAVGQQVEISFYAFPERSFQGKVILVKPTVDDRTRLVSAVVRVDNPKLEIMPGMDGVARIRAPRQGLRAPSVAVMSAAGGSHYLFVVGNDGRAQLRTISVDAQADGYVEVTAGLTAGEQVVVVGQTHLKDQDLVRIGTANDAVP